MAALWYPFSPAGAVPTVRFVRGEGSYVYDDQGRSYLNATSGLWNLAVGSNNRTVVARVETQLRALAYSPLFDASHTPAEMLSQRLVALTNGKMETVYLSTTGTTAVEVAMRVSRLYHRVLGLASRRKILSFDRSYHGCSWMNLSASGLERGDLERWDAVLPDFETIPTPGSLQATSGSDSLPDPAELAWPLAELLEREGGTIAALIVEPVLGSAGAFVLPEGYFKAVTDLCHRHDVLLIADEVATGGGRCGAMFASSLVGLTPDIITLAKGLNAGYFPLGATLFRKAVLEPIRRAGAPLLYGSTQDGNPIACTAALATLDLIDELDLPRRAQILGDRIREGLRDLQEEGPVAEVRGLGLMIGIELVQRFPETRPYTHSEAAVVRRRCMEEGLLVYHFESGISLFPPLTVSELEVEELVETLRTVLRSL